MASQERKGDTHGLHWGDYSFALIWILQAPPIEVGGLLQCVPHTSWNKEKPRVNEYLCRYPVDTYRSEEHTSELQSLMRISYAVFCLKKKKKQNVHILSTTYTTKTKELQSSTQHYIHVQPQ